MSKSGTGLSKNTAAALSYILGPITGIFFLLMEKDEYVRFHAAQSTAVFGFLILLQLFLPFTFILASFVILIGPVALILWIVCMVKAYNGEKWVVPVLGGLSDVVLSFFGGKNKKA